MIFSTFKCALLCVEPCENGRQVECRVSMDDQRSVVIDHLSSCHHLLILRHLIYEPASAHVDESSVHFEHRLHAPFWA